jgi:hypothetical protein
MESLELVLGLRQLLRVSCLTFERGRARVAFSPWHRHCFSSLAENEAILKAIEVDSPVHEVYSQWGRFEDFPHFMHGVKKVTLLDDQRLHWKTEFTGTTKEWFATITDLTPDQRIAWESEDANTLQGSSPSSLLEQAAQD